MQTKYSEKIDAISNVCHIVHVNVRPHNDNQSTLPRIHAVYVALGCLGLTRVNMGN